MFKNKMNVLSKATVGRKKSVEKNKTLKHSTKAMYLCVEYISSRLLIQFGL